MDYSGAEDHEQQGDIGDARVRQVLRGLGGPRLGKQHQREHRRVRADRDRQRLRPHPDRGEDEQDDREFRRAYGESPYGYLMTRHVERAMALLRRGDLSVTEVCFAVGYSSLGTFSSRFPDLVGMPPSTYRRHGARATAGMPSCVAKQMTRPIRNREAPAPEPRLA
jgi:AraC-like DNA-binding protein